MNYDEHPNDSTLTRELRDSLDEVAVSDRPSLTAITDRGRAHRQRRRAAVAGAGGVGVAAGTAVALGLTGILGATPGGTTAAGTTRTATASESTDSPGTTSTSSSIRTAAFILTANANGTDTLILTTSQVFNPAVFQQALARFGIPAVVKTDDTFCASSPAPPSPFGIGVLSIQPPVKPAHKMLPLPSGSLKPNPGEIIANTKMVINPAAIPSGTELFFSYSSTRHALFVDLIYKNSYTCSTGQPPVTP